MYINNLLIKIKSIMYKNILICLLIFRILNSFKLKTLFEPDETFQHIDPINYLILRNTNLTWDWVCGIRSFVFPLLYFIPSLFIKFISKSLSKVLDYHWTEFFIIINFYNIKIINGIMAGFIDFFTIKVAEMIGINIENIVWITIISPINWLYNARSHINNFETFCIMATLYFSIKNAKNRTIYSTIPIYLFICMGTYIRPGYLILTCAHLRKFLFNELSDVIFNSKEIKSDKEISTKEEFMKKETKNIERNTDATFIGCSYDFKPELSRHRNIYILNAAKSFFLIIMIFIWFISIDSLFYSESIIPPINFLILNIVKNINSLFGSQPLYFYFLMMLPLYNIDILILIKEIFIFIKRFIIILKNSEDENENEKESLFLTIFGLTFFIPPLIYLILHSLVDHKELRFMLPIVPLLNIFLANSLYYNFTRKRIIFSLFIFYFIIKIGKYHQNYQIINHLVILMNRNQTHNSFICTQPYQHPLSLLLKDKIKTLTGNPNVKKSSLNLYEYKNIGKFKVNEYLKFIKRLKFNLENLIKSHKYKFIVIDDDLLNEGYDILSFYYKIIASFDYSLNIFKILTKKQYILELKSDN